MRWVYLAVIDFARGGYFAFCPAESRRRDNVLFGIQRPCAARNPNCGHLPHRRGNGRQLVCAIASILQRLTTRSLALDRVSDGASARLHTRPGVTQSAPRFLYSGRANIPDTVCRDRSAQSSPVGNRSRFYIARVGNIPVPDRSVHDSAGGACRARDRAGGCYRKIALTPRQ